MWYCSERYGIVQTTDAARSWQIITFERVCDFSETTRRIRGKRQRAGNGQNNKQVPNISEIATV